MKPDLLPLTRTKTVATLGPASASLPQIEQMLLHGVDVFRLNFAHGSHDEHDKRIQIVRRASRRVGIPAGLLQDLPGPKLRVGWIPGGKRELKRDEPVVLTPMRGDPLARTIPISYARLSRDVKPGHSVYIADGMIRLLVESVADDRVLCRVSNGGVVRSGNGVNMPFSELSLTAFTSADARHLAFGLSRGIDFVGISFVGDASDVRRVRRFCGSRPAFLIAKIERMKALDNLSEILDVADGVMVARGDLGVEAPFAEIPGIQRDIVAMAHKKGRPVILATQVLESMIQNPRPTRAEATDVANAIHEGVDAIMLSGETAMGKFPVETVGALNAVIAAAEKRNIVAGLHLDPILEASDMSQWDIVAYEACRMADRLKADWIVVPTIRGLTAMRISRYRPSRPILTLVNNEPLRRKLSLYWGIRSCAIGRRLGYEGMHRQVRRILMKNRWARRGQTVVVVSGVPGGRAGEAGVVQVLTI